MMILEQYTKSRFSPYCEPMMPCRNYYGNRSKGSNVPNRIVRRDAYEETLDFCQDILGEIKEKYDKSKQTTGAKRVYISSMKKGLSKMEEKTKKMGIDLDKKIEYGENKAEIKVKIVDTIKEARKLISNLENS